MQEKRAGAPRAIALACALLASGGSQAFTFETESIRGSFDSTITVGAGIRTRQPACDLVIQGASGPGAPAGCLAPTSMLGDQGNLNYGRGDAFTTYLKGNHELLLKLPSEVTAMARANWVRDFTATHTTGILSATTPPNLTDGLSDSARDDLTFKARLLDLWVSKGFEVGEQHARVRVGNQVISWGESLFLPGGINSTNAVDIMRLSQPGTQLKEVFLPAPMVSVASGVARGVNVEAYVQTNWNKSYFPPTGSYWSVVNGLGKGADAYGLVDVDAKNAGQWGAAVKYQPAGTQLNLGAYFLNYHDKTPNFSFNADRNGALGWTYLEDRKLYGVSANFPLGDWAVGTELSYRPRDAVALNANSGCTSQNGNCWVDEKRFQWHLTGLLSLTPNGTGGGFLQAVGAQTATLLAEAVVIRYPNLQPTYGGDPVAAGGWGWGQETDPTAAPVPVGTKTSSGINFDFSWVYDGTLVPGWQVTPGVYYFQALSGRTPNASGLFMKGAKSANLYLNFAQNPTKWQFGFNYAMFRGGASSLDQPLGDRDFFGMYLSRNF
ncbi:hypothetical protein GCM10028796_28290 [Ramlibacter monticola]|uniref:DUF1302 domain-containing protein n=1 Tax=Ramlibacter monticola TaxID=1926872 RepID=A0A936Z545_9BURK|nr:DUF1302 domain-containing protein [Ramlibacter monticola]MBL0393880.1 DUF1302 domain-containing protein [Ramlibacter monticola]